MENKKNSYSECKADIEVNHRKFKEHYPNIKSPFTVKDLEGFRSEKREIVMWCTPAMAEAIDEAIKQEVNDAYMIESVKVITNG